MYTMVLVCSFRVLHTYIHSGTETDKDRDVEIPQMLIDFEVRAEFRHIPSPDRFFVLIFGNRYASTRYPKTQRRHALMPA
jgi:hypothetical protein